jgi:Spy/CpxP family protein refolding chaperone
MTSSWRVVILVLVFCAGLSSVAVAQRGTPGTPRPRATSAQAGAPTQAFSFKWWQDVRFKTELGLTSDQCKQAEDVYQGLLPRMTTFKEELDRVEKRLSEVITAGLLPEADVVRMIDQVETARAQLGKVRTLMIYRLRQMLTPDQRAKMKAMHDAWEKERRQGPVRKRPERMPREGGLL